LNEKTKASIRMRKRKNSF